MSGQALHGAHLAPHFRIHLVRAALGPIDPGAQVDLHGLVQVAAFQGGLFRLPEAAQRFTWRVARNAGRVSAILAYGP